MTNPSVYLFRTVEWVERGGQQSPETVESFLFLFSFSALGLCPEKLAKKETGEIKEKEKLEKGNWHERENIGDRVKQDRHQKV